MNVMRSLASLWRVGVTNMITEFLTMPDHGNGLPDAVKTATHASPRERVTGLVSRMLADRAIDRSFSVDDDLREVGLTSLDMVNLVLAVESELAVGIPERDITPANFRSVSSIAALVAALRN